MTQVRCAACPIPVLSERYCKHHSKAFEGLKTGYALWRRAYGDLTWERYLDAISKLDGTGLWALQVARNELAIIRLGPRKI